MATATLTPNVREPERDVRELDGRGLTVREPGRDVRELSIDEAGLLFLDEVIRFEDTDATEHQACLVDPWPTATTRVLCEL